MRNRKTATILHVGIGLALTAVSGGCASPQRLSMNANRYRLEVRLDPVEHRLTGYAVIDLERLGTGSWLADEPAAIDLLLHPDLDIRALRVAGASIKRRSRPRPARRAEDGELVPLRHRVILERPVDRLTVFIDFGGRLFQDVSAGEVEGQIHNFEMHAHIAPEGVYLAGAHWYPEPDADEDAPPGLTDFTLVVGRVDGLELVAGGDFDTELAAETGALAWRSPYPLEGMVLVGGPHEVHRAAHNGVAIELHLKPSQAEQVEGLFDAIRRNLDRYEPLIGAYPAREFRIVDNFFSSGFAFPTFTLLSSAVIDMGKRSQTAHGYIDHEMLHCWWGNGIHVDPRDGNWCEALASYGANYYGYVLDGREDEARRKRRNYSHFLSRISAEKDKPLGTYGLDDGCGRGIAYNKGAAVFHMLARKMGQEKFFEAMRTFTDRFVGAHASWDDIRETCEAVHGDSLEMFFRQWVRQGGAPTFAIENASYDSAQGTLSLALSQTEPVFDLTVPIRITHVDGTLDIEVSLTQTAVTVVVPMEVIPLTVEADPDYHVFRKVSKDDLIPTTAATRSGDAFVSVVLDSEEAASYLKLRETFASSFEEDERLALTVGGVEADRADDGRGDGSMAGSGRSAPGDIKIVTDEAASNRLDAMGDRSVLVLGEAVRDPQVAAFLRMIEYPITWTADGFTFDGTTYSDDADAVMCTARHPAASGAGVTVIFANSEAAIPRPMLIPFYDHSIVIFKDGRPAVRHDLERRRVVDVERS